MVLPSPTLARNSFGSNWLFAAFGMNPRPGWKLTSAGLAPNGAAIQPSLRWRPQFALEPARCFPRFHRIVRRFEHARVAASWAFERSNVETERTGRDPRPHRRRFALRTWWSVVRAHDVDPPTSGGSTTLSVTDRCRYGAGDADNFFTSCPDRLVNTEHLSEKLTKVNYALMRRFGFVLPGALDGGGLIESFLGRRRWL